MSRAIKVYEDDGGNLYMTDGARVVGGLEHPPKPGGLLADMLTWEDWRDDVTDVYEYDPVEINFSQTGYKLIAFMSYGSVELYPDSMGHSGRRYAGIREE